MNVSAFPGQFVSWSCEVQSTIPLQFMWYLNEQPILNVTGSYTNMTSSSSYSLNNVSYFDHSSNIRCSATGNTLIVNSSDVYLTGKFCGPLCICAYI